MRTEKELTALFRKLGADKPESWAASQAQEGINQLGRFVFLRQAWRHVLRSADPTWVDHMIAASERRPNDPGSGIGPALRRLKDAGASTADIVEVVRVAQWELLFNFCYLLDDPGELEPELEDFGHCATPRCAAATCGRAVAMDCAKPSLEANASMDHHWALRDC